MRYQSLYFSKIIFTRERFLVQHQLKDLFKYQISTIQLQKNNIKIVIKRIVFVLKEIQIVNRESPNFWIVLYNLANVLIQIKNSLFKIQLKYFLIIVKFAINIASPLRTALIAQHLNVSHRHVQRNIPMKKRKMLQLNRDKIV